MPVMDGYDATRAIRNLPGGDRVFIVALTASAFEEDRKQVLAAGCDELIRKPIETEQLFRVIAGLLQVRFEYAEAAPAPAPKGSGDLGALPEAIRHELMQRALELDKEALLGLVARIRPQWPEEAKQIAELADEYRYDRIEALCKGG